MYTAVDRPFFRLSLASSGREVAKLGGPRLALHTKYYRARAQAVLVAPENARRAEAVRSRRAHSRLGKKRSQTSARDPYFFCQVWQTVFLS